MFGTHDLWLFAATVFVLNATPGVDLMLVLARTLEHGVRGGIAAALGVSTGCVLHALAAAFGLAALLAASASAFTIVKWVGAAYLLWLAFGMLRSAVQPAARRAAAEQPAAGGRDACRLFRQGLLTNALNPKVALFFLALLPQFIDAAAPHKTLAFLFLGAWFVVQGTTFLVAFVLLIAPLARWRPTATMERALHAVGGTLFVALAARLAWARP
ncbi:MAG: LysE family translocator [Caldimonas sp.]